MSANRRQRARELADTLPVRALACRHLPPGLITRSVVVGAVYTSIMDLILLRHADAGDAEEFAKTGKSDHLRPLSPKGHERGRASAKGLRALIPECDLIATSPFTRAKETAEIVASVYKSVATEKTASLEPGESLSDFADWLRQRASAKVVIAVGHEPHLGSLATWLIAGARQSGVELKKSGACLITFDGPAAKGAGQLKWLMGPQELAAAKDR